MEFWIALAVLTGIAIAAVLWPLVARGRGAQPAAAYDAAVYRDQLAELERDVGRGLIGASEAAAARSEIARRLLAAAKQSGGQSLHNAIQPKGIILAGLIGIPALSLAVYLALGQPLMPGVPHAERLAHAMENQDYAALIAQVEQHLAERPEDAQGWSVLAPIYLKQGRYVDAANAYGRLIALSGERADLLTSYAEALILADGGIVTEKAREAVDRGLALDPKLPKARFYKGLAAKQDGDRDQALKIWRALLADAPQDAPWRQFVQRNIDEVEGGTSGPPVSRERMGAVTSQSPAQQREMIRGMVDGLEARLNANSGPLDDWLKLAQARMVLGEQKAALAALDRASERFRSDNAALARIDEARRLLHQAN